MKANAKILLAGLITTLVLTQAHAMRWYSPTTGRWFSRDPLNERGSVLLRRPPASSTSAPDPELGIDLGALQRAAMEQASPEEEMQLYTFCNNDGVNSVDELGLMTVQDINNIIHQREANAAKTPCSCTCKPDNVLFSIKGASQSATTVYGFVPLSQALGHLPCTLDPQIYWWDCYSASSEAGWASNWSDYGWSIGGLTYIKTAQPGVFSPISTRDPYHLAMVALYIYDSCDHGKRAVKRITSNRMQWTWDKRTKAWTGPAGF